MGAPTNGFQLFLAQRIVDSLLPPRKSGDRPWRKQLWLRLRILNPAPKGTPSPLLRLIDQASAFGIPFYIPTNDQKMLIVLDGKALVSLLIYMPKPSSVIMSMIAHRMRAADPFHKSAHFTIAKRP